MVPGIRFIDLTEGVLCLEWVDGRNVRVLLGGDSEEGEDSEDSGTPAAKPDRQNLSEYNITDGMAHSFCQTQLTYRALIDEVMNLVGAQLAKMHQGDIIHGDLTTSNMMLRRNTALPEEPAEVVRLTFPETQFSH
jgi:TP53 regulating kinase-like protein